MVRVPRVDQLSGVVEESHVDAELWRRSLRHSNLRVENQLAIAPRISAVSKYRNFHSNEIVSPFRV